MKARLSSIQQFLQQKTVAVAGVSRKEQGFGNVLYKELKARGLTVYPVNPNMDTFQGAVCYPNITSLPADVKGLVIVTPPSQTLSLIKEGEAKGIRHFWVQQGAQSQEAIDYAKESPSNIIFKECLMMFAEPVKGAHGFHRFFRKLFKTYPRQ